MKNGMSVDMYEYIVNNLSSIDYNIDDGTIITPKGTNGTICSSTGYLRVKVKGRLLQVHQILAVVYFGEDCIGKQVNHIDGNKLNNKEENLEVVSMIENIKHAWNNGLYTNTGINAPRGDDNINSKLSTEDVIYIRENTHLTSIELSVKFGISSSAIRRVRRRETYKHVE